MLKEYHYDHLIRWPRGERAAVFLTFDFQGGEDVKPDKNGFLNYEMWSQGEYGPHHAIYRLLRILKEEDIKATFLTCGAIAERFPEAVQAILDHGHVVEGHGYNHEIARYLPRDEEDQVMKKTIAMVHKRTGRRCYGWRSSGRRMASCWSSCRASRSVTARCSATATANTEIRITGWRPGRPISTSSTPRAARSVRNTFHSPCIPTSSADPAVRWRCAASSIT